MTTSLTVLLAGSSGVLGRHVTRVLTGAGHHVIGLGRGPENQLRADLLQREAVLRAVGGVHADVVVHAATALRRPPMRHRLMFATDDLRVIGTRHLLEVARAVGARRFVGENIVLGYGYREFDGRLLTEADAFGVPAGERNLDRHLEGMRLKEELPLAVPGLEAVSLRYGLFYGEGATDSITQVLRRRRLPVCDDGGRALPWVNLADAATAMLAAIERGRPGQAYNIADESRLGFGGMVRAVAEAIGAPPPLTIPRWTTVAMPYVRAILGVNMRVSTEKARSELGWTPAYPTVADGLRAGATQRR